MALGPIVLLIMAEDFIQPEAYDAAILLSGKTSLNNGPNEQPLQLEENGALKNWVATNLNYQAL